MIDWNIESVDYTIIVFTDYTYEILPILWKKIILCYLFKKMNIILYCPNTIPTTVSNMEWRVMCIHCAWFDIYYNKSNNVFISVRTEYNKCHKSKTLMYYIYVI